MHDPLPDRMVFNDIESFIKDRRLDIHNPKDAAALKEQFAHECVNSCEALESLIKFCHIEPRLPNAQEKAFSAPEDSLGLTGDMTREQVIDRLREVRDGNEMANMAFYAYRDLRETEAEPFLVAGVRRNPVSVEACKDLETDAVIGRITEMPNESIYDGPGRLAQPDEVWNYGRGDGVEKGVLLANILRARNPEADLTVDVEPDFVVINGPRVRCEFDSSKELHPQVWHIPAV